MNTSTDPATQSNTPHIAQVSIRCRYGTKCNKPDCKYDHVKKIAYCKFGDKCILDGCSYDHAMRYSHTGGPVMAQLRPRVNTNCPHGLACDKFKTGECPNGHPTAKFCKSGNRCLNRSRCGFAHTSGCQAGSTCETRETCPKSHFDPVLCAHGPNCHHRRICKGSHFTLPNCDGATCDRATCPNPHVNTAVLASA